MNKKSERAKQEDRLHHKEVEDALTFMLLCERGFGVPSFEFFDGSIIGWPSVIHDIAIETLGTIGAPIAEYFDIAARVRPIRGSLVLGGSVAADRWSISGGREMDYLSKKRLSMMCKQMVYDEKSASPILMPIDPNKRIVEIRAAGISESGTSRSLIQNYYLHDDRSGQWFPAKPEGATGKTDDDGFTGSYEVLTFSSSVLWTCFCLKRWQVYIRFGEQKPGISLPTDPTGVKEFFQFREIPEGKPRRDALLHWVSEHWRQNRHDPDVENYVREHLRGSRRFEWHGLNAEILIPQVDQNKEAGLIVKRKRLKKSQLDRRIKDARR